MDKELIKLIEDNGLTLHGDIEYFAHLIAEREREALMKVLDLCDEAMSWDLGGEPLPILEIEARKAIAAIRARGGE